MEDLPVPERLRVREWQREQRRACERGGVVTALALCPACAHKPRGTTEARNRRVGSAQRYSAQCRALYCFPPLPSHPMTAQLILRGSRPNLAAADCSAARVAPAGCGARQHARAIASSTNLDTTLPMATSPQHDKRDYSSASDGARLTSDKLRPAALRAARPAAGWPAR